MTRDLLNRRRADRESRLPRHTTQTVTVDFDNPAPPGASLSVFAGVFGGIDWAPISGAGEARGAPIPLATSSSRHRPPAARPSVLAVIAPAGLASTLLRSGRNAHADRRHRPVQGPGDSGRATRDRDQGLNPAVDDRHGCVHGQMGALRYERDPCCVAVAGDRPPAAARSRIRATISHPLFRRFAKLQCSRVSRSERSSVRCGSSWH